MLRLDWNLVFTVINLIVMLLLMKKYLIGPVTNVMDKRRALIEGQLLNASNTEKSAMDLKQQYETSIKEVGTKTDIMLEAARKNASAEYDRIVDEANEKAERMIKDAETAISLDREKTLREIESEIAGLALIAAKKIVCENADGSLNQSLYDDFLKKSK